jgi:hypothetical protein
VHDLGAALGVVANTEAVMTAVVGNARKANTEYQFAIDASLVATAALDVQFEKAGKFIMLVRDNLKPIFGTRYSETWNKVGFFNRTLKVPQALKLRASLLKAIELFLDARPDLEIPNVMTKAMAETLYENFSAAMAASRDAKVEQRQKREVRDAAVAKLRLRITALRNELKPLLAADDPRWLDFGFGVPADVHVPAAPENLVVTVDPVTSHVVASWDDTVNTDRFRVYQRVIGTDTEYKPVDTTTDTSFDLGKFASGAQVEVQVTAINSAGESVPSTTSVVVP